jgi:hypothetical protein
MYDAVFETFVIEMPRICIDIIALSQLLQDRYRDAAKEWSWVFLLPPVMANKVHLLKVIWKANIVEFLDQIFSLNMSLNFN